MEPGAPDPLIGKKLAERYVVRRLIGAGAMGAVYEAEQVPIGRKVAVKVLLGGGEDDPAIVKRFFRENGRIRLQPENESLEPLYPTHVQVLGKVIGVFRRV